MAKIASFRDIIELWGRSRESLAVELPGATATQVSKWWQRDSIPAEYWLPLLSTERARSAGLTADLLAALASCEPAEARA